ncbi:MAG TPA: SAM-dependent methyltransferase [Cyanobacteria bacterium UBA11149]|nr:SAM-dependent methyltransferase [Cyanobacteria bacterium UBA11367]HBE60681.1 SAM-dependent methyltransferase [Cyanobacteria bacterium UBA11366]HBK63891.1 SAM-dependent methyltransferase [Cyanobacteria bacterium UBA11166]HBR72984.1 SAM-dependent methyltransferase [Cyanobacteria bacterium UBA11159]HBS69443.1 SAM-dependent methyltransferase [Cyanobacteria bacterium UBA11153]HBW91960.1 SAM-dependent methyltransferase [Cyanobacteria bacterium UBA11149]HCA96023.1 SAM-dependent methyltransferase 
MDNQNTENNAENQSFTIENFVSLSAQLVAAVRARETARNDRLFTDPFAAELAGKQALEMAKEREERTKDSVADRLAIRTRFFDDFLIDAVSEVRQVVILAAGMDARAFRLPWPDGTIIYELDKAEVLAKKEAILKEKQPLCHRKAIAADLTQPWQDKLLEQGYQNNVPSVWLLEGLLMYLTEEEVYNLLRNIWDIVAIGSYLGTDILNVYALQSQDLAAKYWRSGFDYPEEIFASIGWYVKVFEAGQPEANFGRFNTEVPPRDVLDIPRGFLIQARKLANKS